MRERTRKPPVCEEPSLADQVLQRHASEEEDESFLEDPPRLFLPTGCSLLNCVLSDRVDGGWPCGRISNAIGDSDTCKTTLGMSALAEACKLPAFDNHQLIYADVEEAVAFDISKRFGKKLASRINLLQAINEDRKNQPPDTVEELHYQIMDLIESGTPFIYIVDSLDMLTSKGDVEKTKELRKAWKKDRDSVEEESTTSKKPKGSYQMSKPKSLKQMFREIMGAIAKTDSILIFISQTIDNIGSMFNPKTVTGGNALEFCCRIRFWLSFLNPDKVGKIIIGRNIKCKLSKNHITGKHRELALWVYEQFGIDDIRTSIDFLCSEGAWPKNGGWIVPKGLTNEKIQLKDLIRKIETCGWEAKLDRLVQRKWNQIEESLRMDRRPKYE